jgi:nucleoside-diphosphate-sugar epimerase
MRIAILGATSQIAKDLVQSFAANSSHDLVLYARRPGAVTQWLTQTNLAQFYKVADFAAFTSDEHFDAILNFVGVGNPAQAAAMGASIFDVTLKFDELALDYVRQHPACRYIFLSSGAAYGSSFDSPADANTKAVIDINHLQPQDWYGVAKLHAECRHRSLPHLHIVDIRVFNYFSHTQDVSARFLITDIVRAIKSCETLITSSANIVRDFIGPDDFYQLVTLLLVAPVMNEVVDCYTSAPVEKMTLLSVMKNRAGLKYEITNLPIGLNTTGIKQNYYSTNRFAGSVGYAPTKTSMESVLYEFYLMNRRNGFRCPH